MASVGNAVANQYWEAKLGDDVELPDPSNTYQMSNFIRQKYVAKKWAADGPPPAPSPAETPKSPVVSRRPIRQQSMPLSPPTRKQQPFIAPHSVSDADIEAFLEPESPRRPVPSRQSPPDTVSSATRKPGRQIPQRLVRKMKGSSLSAPRQKPTSAGSEPNLAQFAGSDDDDPFA
jgi:hypothetical protein